MQLDEIKKEYLKRVEWKNIAPLHELIKNLPTIHDAKISFDDAIKIETDINQTQKEQILHCAKELKPWRKGPFEVFDIFIDTEWQSFIKYNLLAPHINLKDKVVADIGCNNGYYMFRMLKDKPKKVIGFDPSALTYMQFLFLNHFIKSDIVQYELLGIEHVEFYNHKFDVIFCLGVLYHRSDPISSLKSLHKALNIGGEVIIDTIIINEDGDYCLFPKDRYAGMKNVYFFPTISALKNWLFRAGFEDIVVLAIKPTDFEEQRKTEWIDSFSLNNFLQNDDVTKTIEGYPAPVRAYVKARKIK
ncbi:MAG: tRNA carboxymethyltransferase [Campylobacterota bacterium]|nr:tRNA carboxymethyltransferase [Campylobacterota bacterium]